jgi:hypothetical protein
MLPSSATMLIRMFNRCHEGKYLGRAESPVSLAPRPRW